MQFLYIKPQKRENDEDDQRPNDACSDKNTEGDRKALLRDTLSQSAAIGHYGPPLSWQAQAGQRFLFPLALQPRPSAP